MCSDLRVWRVHVNLQWVRQLAHCTFSFTHQSLDSGRRCGDGGGDGGRDGGRRGLTWQSSHRREREAIRSCLISWPHPSAALQTTHMLMEGPQTTPHPLTISAHKLLTLMTSSECSNRADSNVRVPPSPRFYVKRKRHNCIYLEAMTHVGALVHTLRHYNEPALSAEWRIF